MNEQSNILAETKNISPLVAGIGNQNPYQAPAGFFGDFPLELIGKLKSQNNQPSVVQTELDGLSPLLASTDRVSPFSTPQGYFDALHQQSLLGVRAVDFVQNSLNNPSVLSQPELHQTPYSVPQGYFETLPSLIQSKVAAIPATPVVRMQWMRYAVAAALVGVMAMVGWLGWMAVQSSNAGTEVVQVEKQIQSVNDEELSSYIQQQSPLVQTDLALLDENLSDSDIQSILSEYADDELLQFVNETIDENRIIEN